MIKPGIAMVCAILLSLVVEAQDKGVFSGNFQSNFSVFMKDTAIGADEGASPQYGKQLTSAESWLFLNYDIKDFHFAARHDLFNNSNLLNPNGAFTGQGIGFWQIRKRIEGLEVTAGSFYDQFGSGLIFRAYENRLIGLDYAMQGVHVKYDIGTSTSIKAFTGKQKGGQELRFETTPQIVKGVNAEHSYAFNDGTILNLGASAINRTLDEQTMSDLVVEINGMPIAQRFYPKYNVYAFNGYFDLNYREFSFMAEYNRKSKEAIRVQDRNLSQKLALKDGEAILAGISYSKGKLGKDKKGGLGVNLQYRRIKDFPLLVTPYATLLDGFITYQPSLARQASYRLVARYNAPAQYLGEEGVQAEVNYTLNSKTKFQFNYSTIRMLNDTVFLGDTVLSDTLFNEFFFQLEHKFSKKFKGKIGFQTVFYNQAVYEGESTYEDVVTATPFVEFTYKINRRNSLRFESQYLSTKQDLGSFFNGILEWNSSPHFTVAISDMINVDPQRQQVHTLAKRVLHYPSVFLKYNIHTTSFTAAYVKQVEGVNCTGGICRLEPAFSGLRFTLATQF